jgi:tRNA/rRNA methyltransferase
MKNFGFRELIVLNPEPPDFPDYETYGFAMHGRDILDRARVIRTSPEEHVAAYRALLREFDVVIGTTGKGEHYANLKRLPLFLDQLQLPELGSEQKVCLVLGRESRGLTNEEIMLVDFVVRIRADPDYSSLNLAQAAGIILYYLFQQFREPSVDQVIAITAEQKDSLNDVILDIVNLARVRTARKERVLRAFQNVFGRAFMSQKEFKMIYGMFLQARRELALRNPEGENAPKEGN